LAPATSTTPARESSSRRRSWSVPPEALHAALRLGAAGRDRDDPELDEGPAHLAERACLVPGPPAAGQGRLEAAVPVAVDRAREPRAEGDCPEELEVPRRVLLGPEDRSGDASGGVVDRAEERDLRPPGSQPVMAAPVELEEQALGRHPRAPAPVARGPVPAGRGDPLRPQDPPDARAGQRDPLPLREQLGEVGVVGSGIAAPARGRAAAPAPRRGPGARSPGPGWRGRARPDPPPGTAPTGARDGARNTRVPRPRPRVPVRPRRRGSGPTPDAAR
jgi:hypothetical protein